MRLDPKKIAVQMDGLGKLDISSDTTVGLIEEAVKRGHYVFMYLPETMSFNIESTKHLNIYAHCQPFINRRGNDILEMLKHPDKYWQPAQSEVPGKRNLTDFDIILMRQEPPFDMNYITYTHLLEHIETNSKNTRVINNPAGVRNSPEKLLVTQFRDLMPPTLISKDILEIEEFMMGTKYVLKPLYGKGGEGISLLDTKKKNAIKDLDAYLADKNEPIMVQQYLPEVKKGDKRIILVNGEPVGCLNRIPAKGEFRSNLGVGGKPELSKLTSTDKKICSRIKDKLLELGLYFVGIDVIGDYLTEINVTCPTGIRQIKNLGGPDIAKLFWDRLEL